MSARHSRAVYATVLLLIFSGPIAQGRSERAGEGGGAPGETCSPDYQWFSDSPFMVSAEFKNEGKFPVSGHSYNRNWENFRDRSDSENVIGYIPQGSIVKVLDPQYQPADAARQPQFVPVEVLGMPTELTAEKGEDNKQLRDLLSSGLERVKVRARGRMHSEALKPAADFTYVVTRDSFLGRIIGFDNFKMGKARALEFVTRESGGVTQYKAKRCCKPMPGGQGEFCHFRHLFKILDDKMNKLGEVDLDAGDCSFLNNVRPMDKKNALAILQIAEMAQRDRSGLERSEIEYIDSMGLVKFPFSYDTQEGPFNTFHYTPDGGEDKMTDAYINAGTGCALMRILEAWNRDHPRDSDQVQIGDLWHLKVWGEHRSHEQMQDHGGAQGTCIDIRPLSSSAERAGLTYKDDRYDREKTQAFVDLVKRAGADTILFNDSKIKGRTNSKRKKNHDDHIHFCLNPNDEAVASTCKDGL